MAAAGLVAERPLFGVLTAGRARAIGWTLFGVGTALRVVDLWLAAHRGPDSIQFSLGAGFEAFGAAIVLGTACSLVGAIIVSRRPRNTTGWLYVLVGIIQSALTAGLAYAGFTLPNGPTQPALTYVWLNDISDFALPFSIVALLLALYPDGHLVGPRWRFVAALAVLGGLLRTLEVGFGLDHLALLAGSPNPYQASGPIGDLLSTSDRLGIASLLLALGAAGAAASLVVRYRRASLDGRRQIQWLLLAGAAVFVCSLPLAYSQLIGGTGRPPIDLFAVSFASLSLAPVATLIAITRYRLYEIDRLVNRALVYGSLTAVLAGVFTAGIGLAQRLFVSMTGESSDAAIVLTTLVVATLYAPLRKRLEHVVDARFRYDAAAFGAYRSAIDAVREVVEPGAAATRLAAEAVDALNAVGAAVIGRTGMPLATAGSWPTTVDLTIPLGDADLPLRILVVGPRRDGKPHDPIVAADLADVARLAATSVIARAKADA